MEFNDILSNAGLLQPEHGMPTSLGSLTWIFLPFPMTFARSEPTLQLRQAAISKHMSRIVGGV